MRILCFLCWMRGAGSERSPDGHDSVTYDYMADALVEHHRRHDHYGRPAGQQVRTQGGRYGAPARRTALFEPGGERAQHPGRAEGPEPAWRAHHSVPAATWVHTGEPSRRCRGGAGPGRRPPGPVIGRGQDAPVAEHNENSARRASDGVPQHLHRIPAGSRAVADAAGDPGAFSGPSTSSGPGASSGIGIGHVMGSVDGDVETVRVGPCLRALPAATITVVSSVHQVT
ncbi:hypothetical protein FsymDg_0314 [Candidatus Protofrankia datiscae]|uniref:Uncharacterized protein n=1 Tax=Candidatus Protofrankia datiscae TaxID=2716812 RepID=F8B3P4_9ACTN|nr:hypothetical protein FsymDg_0314 [Candidatus Protofrankia datiscae]